MQGRHFVQAGVRHTQFREHDQNERRHAILEAQLSDLQAVMHMGTNSVEKPGLCSLKPGVSVVFTGHKIRLAFHFGQSLTNVLNQEIP